MQNEMRDRLVGLLVDSSRYIDEQRGEVIADFLLENGVVVLDTDVLLSEYRPLIKTIADMPLNEVIELIKAKREGRIIIPPCKVGDMIYYNLGKNASLPLGTKRTLCLKVGTIANMENKEDWFVRTEFSGAIADFKFSDFGKTVFLTREEAEKKTR